MTIGEVAKLGGLRASAIRYYEKSGLLPKPMRAGGQRRYDGAILERLAVLERAKDCGFTLEEVRTLFHGFRSDVSLSKRWQDLARQKIAELDALAERVTAMKELLERAQKCQCLDFEECGRRILEGQVSSRDARRGRA
jgi:MerR family redox-sensitive transcriptional activator SoxR